MGRKLKRDGMLYQNRFSYASLIVILGMYVIAGSYYDPDSMMRKGAEVVTGEANIGGDFDTVDHNGKPFTQANLLNKYSLIFFGFTHCPDICPTTFSTLSDVYSQLTPKQRNITQIIMASVDPMRDTVEIMAEYAPAFNRNFIGLTGTDKQMAAMAKKYLVYVSKQKADAEGNYSVDHSGYVYLMGPDGKYVKHFSYKDPAEKFVKALQGYLIK